MSLTFLQVKPIPAQSLSTCLVSPKGHIRHEEGLEQGPWDQHGQNIPLSNPRSLPIWTYVPSLILAVVQMAIVHVACSNFEKDGSAVSLKRASMGANVATGHTYTYIYNILHK